MSTPKPPPGTRPAGRALWDSVLADFELDEHETALLREAVRTVDALDQLDRLVQSEGVVQETPQGQRAHPALVEARQQRIALARLLAALRLPSGEGADTKPSSRPQRRAGARGAYLPRAVS